MKCLFGRQVILLIALIAVLAIGVGGCGDDDDDDATMDDDDTSDDDDIVPHDDDTADDDDDDDIADDDDDDVSPQCDWAAHDQLIVAGKAHLGESEIYEGYEAFQDALDTCPDSIDAHMGLALALQLELERQVYEFIRYVLSNPITPKGDDKGFGSLMQSMMLEILIPKAEEMMAHAELVSEAPANWSFYIEKYPFLVEGQFTDIVHIDLGGEWDHADVTWLMAQAQFYRGAFYFLCSYDLTIDYGWLTTFPALSGTPKEMLHDLTGWILGILNDLDYQQSLTLYQGVGSERMTEAGLAFGWFYKLLAEGSNMMLFETDDQEDDVSGYHDLNGNWQWDQGEYHKLPWMGYLTEGQQQLWDGLMSAAVSAGYSTWNGSELDVNPNRPDWFWLNELNPILVALSLQPVLPPIPIDFGDFYYNQGQTQVKDSLRTLIMILYVLTSP